MQVTRQVRVDRTADEVWEIVGRGFGDVATWARAVAASRPVPGPGTGGAPCQGRTCTIAVPGFTELTEELTEYDEHRRTLAYRAASGMPAFVLEATNRWSVEEGADPGACIFTMEAEVRLSPLSIVAGPALGLYLGRIGRNTCRDLKTYAETGHTAASSRGAALPRLETAVATNAVFSAVCGSALASGAGDWASRLGASEVVVSALGAGLLGYGAALGVLLARGVGATAGRSLALLDAGWVLASALVLVLVGHRMEPVGVAATVGAGLAVGALGWWQWSAAGRLLPGRDALEGGDVEDPHLPVAELDHAAPGEPA